MNYRNLGRTGLRVSEIGFGGWGIGGAAGNALGYGRTDDQDSRRALQRALDLGVNFYDTASLYGYGHSEVLLGEAFKAVRKSVQIASKVGRLDSSGRQDFSPEFIRGSLESSLRRLQTDYLDLYQLHDPDLDLLRGDGRILEVMEGFYLEGKIRAWGISARTPMDALAAAREFGPRVLQANFNLLDQRALENGLIGLCASEGIGLIIRTPLCFGFLTGAYSSDTPFDPNDHRSRWPEEQRAHWAKAYRLFTDVCGASGQTPAQLALRFCLSYEGVSTAIPGMLTSEQVEENVLASALGRLDADQRRSIERIYSQEQFFLAPKTVHQSSPAGGS